MTTLLQGVNRVLRRTQIITSDLTSFTSSGKQPWIDTAVYCWNEALIMLYETADVPFPSQSSSDSITLVTGTRSYTLASDLIKLHWPLHDETNGQYITEFPGGFLKLYEMEYFPSNYTGLAYRAAFNPTDGTLYLDYIPTSDENGRVYTYYYDKNLEMSATTDVFPFNNHVFLMMVPAVAEMWRRENKRSFDEKLYMQYMGKAASFLRQIPQRKSWLPLSLGKSEVSPYEQ